METCGALVPTLMMQVVWLVELAVTAEVLFVLHTGDVTENRHQKLL